MPLDCLNAIMDAPAHVKCHNGSEEHDYETAPRRVGLDQSIDRALKVGGTLEDEILRVMLIKIKNSA